VCRFAERANSGRFIAFLEATARSARIAESGLGANNERFIAFLEELHRRFGKVLIYLDNAGWHKSVAVKEYLDDHGGDVVLRYLPPYTPEINPVEVQRRSIRKATGNRLYESTDERK